jgi:glycosyltransferase involved in cell wall biosynthesis
MRSLRILFVSRSLPFHGLGGMETVAWDLARAFAARGHEVAVLTTRCSRLASERQVENVTLYPLDVPSGRYSAAWWRESRRCYDTRLKGRFDIVLSISAGAMSIAAARDASDPALYVAQAHGTLWGEIVSKTATFSAKNWVKALINLTLLWGERRYRHFDAMVAIGPRVTADTGRWPTRALLGGLPVHEISNGIDTDSFRFDAAARAAVRARYGIAPEAPTVLALSRLHVQKGLQHALEAVARARRDLPGLRFLIVGAGPHEDALKGLSHRLGLDATAIFTGAIDRAEVPSIYAAADAFLFTSTRIEGLPLNILEALACGLPVILSRHLALTGQSHQYPVDPQHYDAVAATIISTIAAVAGMERSCFLDPTYQLATAVDRYLDLFASLLEA